MNVRNARRVMFTVWREVQYHEILADREPALAGRPRFASCALVCPIWIRASYTWPRQAGSNNHGQLCP